jgi:spermidine synthase
MGKRLILLIFGLSGMAALIYEVVWSRLLQVIFGSTIYTASTIFAAFLLGFSIGAFLFRKIADTTNRPLSFLALIEILIGLYGIFIIFIFRFISKMYVFLPDSLISRLILCMIVLLPPTILFGAVWPFINRYYIKDIDKLGRGTGSLYSVNSIGSALGAFASGFVFVPLFGFKITSIIAGFLNIIAGLLLVRLKKTQDNGENEKE